MCGIAGVVGRAAVQHPHGMVDVLCHRGPDDCGTWSHVGHTTHVWLGHRRLSIIDLTAGGHQPMSRSSNALVITFNGEIYNYVALRDTLCREGHTFVGNSDTEVILAAWEQWGEHALSRLEGMFAFALWDKRTEVLWLARDRMGEKPLYYHATADRMVFASELRAILASGVVPRVLDPDGLESYLAYGSVSQPLTLVRNVRMLGAGQVLRYHDGKIAVDDYWTQHAPIPAPYPHEYDAACTDVRHAVDTAIQACMTADVPIALLLSGGVDSTAILARLTALGYRGLTTFNVDFAGTDAAFNETAWAVRVAREFGACYKQVTIQSGEIAGLMRAAVASVDQPSVDGFNHYLAFQAIAAHGFKVALTGQGADELFYGYGRHRAFAMSYRAALLRLPARIRHGLARTFTALVPEGQRLRKSVSLLADGERTALVYASRHLIYTAEEMAHLLGRPVENPIRFLPHAVGDTPIAKLYDIETRHFLRNQLLRDGDQMSMAVSLELRAPFVDYRLVDMVTPMPTHFKIKKGRQKPLLVDAMDHPLITAMANRPKKGFPFPLRRWLQEEIDVGVIAPSMIGVEGARVRQVLARGTRGVEHMQAWTLSVLAVWMRDNQIVPN